MQVNEIVNEYYSFLNQQQRKTLYEYLSKRFSCKPVSNKLNVVFDLLHDCNLNCVGCGTDAKQCASYNESGKLSLDEIQIILDKIRKYTDDKKIEVFVNFGGGEPFLRKDIVEIIKYANSLFGANSIGIDTNASINKSYLLIKEIAPYVSYIGVSLNGLKEYHNWWTNKESIDAFSRTFNTLEMLCKEPELVWKIEVTSVATKKNISIIPELMKALSDIGVKNYSIHRSVPVGRMEKSGTVLIPSSKEYLSLLISMVETAQNLGMNAHFHHSIESIHATLFCGINTISEEKVFDKNYRSSIGISPEGRLVVNPWCVGQYWDVLTVNSILDNDFGKLISDMNKKIELLSAGLFDLGKCRGCQQPCPGGSRIVAASTWLNNNRGGSVNNALQAMDPACPLARMESVR